LFSSLNRKKFADDFLFSSLNRRELICECALTGFKLRAPIFLGLFRGHISLKKGTYHPLLRESASPFKSTCLLIKLK
jgi:hypothetical protein